METLAQQGFKLPKRFSVKFSEETKGNIFIPIPPYVRDKTGRKMSLLNLQPAVKNVFVLGGFDKIFNI